jgi:hypothetical protein
MRKTEKVKQRVCSALVALAQRFPEKTQKVPAWARLILKFDTDLAPVSAVNNLAQQSTKGLTLEKNNTLSDLKISVGRFCNVMVANALEAQNVALESDLKTLRTKFTQAKQDDLAEVGKEVVAEIRKYETKWADMGVSPNDLTTVEALIALFEEQTPKGKILKTDKKKATKQRTAIFESLYTQTQILDVAAGFIGVDDEYFGDIQEAMGIKKRASAATQIRAIIKSATMQVPMMNQQARVSGTEMASKSSKKGEIVFKFTHAGFYTIEIPLPNGEVRIIKDVEVKRGRTTKLEIFI